MSKFQQNTTLIIIKGFAFKFGWKGGKTIVMFINCPSCGHKLLEGEKGSCVTVKCSKCKSIVLVKIEDNSTNISIVRHDNCPKWKNNWILPRNNPESEEKKTANEVKQNLVSVFFLLTHCCWTPKPVVRLHYYPECCGFKIWIGQLQRSMDDST